MAPGPVRAALSTSIEVRRISGHDRVTVLRARRRMASFLEAQTLESTTSMVDAYDTELGYAGGDATAGAAAEIRVSVHLTTGQLAARIRHLCPTVDPDGAACRYRDAMTHRRIVTQPTPNGTVDSLGLDLPPDRVAAATDRIEALARSLRHDGETRTWTNSAPTSPWVSSAAPARATPPIGAGSTCGSISPP